MYPFERQGPIGGVSEAPSRLPAIPAGFARLVPDKCGIFIRRVMGVMAATR